MNDAFERITQIVDTARSDGRGALRETESIEILATAGFNVPPFVYIPHHIDMESADLTPIKGDRAVVKVVSEEILHKTDVGGVAVVENDGDEIRGAIEKMRTRLSHQFTDGAISGFTVHQHIEYDHSFGRELLLGFRWTEDFGPVVVLGTGGVHAEALASHFNTGSGIGVFSPRVPPIGGVESAITKTAVVQIAAYELRGRPPIVEFEKLVDACQKMAILAEQCAPALLTDVEINPLVISGGELFALDALAIVGEDHKPALIDRPVEKIKILLEPKSIAIVGASETRQNPGRAILGNTLREGYDPSRIYLVKQGCDSIDGCRCVPDISSLPGKVDLIVLAVSAKQIPRAISETIEGEKADSIIVIPGGLEEKSGGSEAISGLHDEISRSRQEPWRGPVINGGNSLGIRSRPGNYDTLFIPQYKLGKRTADEFRVALLSQSGAFTIAQSSKLSSVGMRYTISIGNQMDLTVGDYLDYLERDRAVDIAAVYLEGLKPQDGIRFLDAARRFTVAGRTVILYSGGRNEAGADAAASHTASIAGNYTVTRELALGAGIVVAETLEDFVDYIMLFDSLHDKPLPRSRGALRLGAFSNAGFECVAMADNLGAFRFESFSSDTNAKLAGVLERAGLHTIVDVKNPLDVTPMLTDPDYETVSRAILTDGSVDVGVVGCSPFTPALNTLPPGDGHRENLQAPDGIVSRLIGMRTDIEKPWVVVVDGGSPYDEMRGLLHQAGVPTFNAADRALRLFSEYCAIRRREYLSE